MRSSQQNEEQIMRFIQYLELRPGKYEIGMMSEIKAYYTLKYDIGKTKLEVTLSKPCIQPMSNNAKRIIIGEFLKEDAKNEQRTKHNSRTV